MNQFCYMGTKDNDNYTYKLGNFSSNVCLEFNLLDNSKVILLDSIVSDKISIINDKELHQKLCNDMK